MYADWIENKVWMRFECGGIDAESALFMNISKILYEMGPLSPRHGAFSGCG
jgi:hypothetical protein